MGGSENRNSWDSVFILHFDFYRDRFRTAINVLGDAVGACIVERLSLKDLQADANATRGSKDTVITSM